MRVIFMLNYAPPAADANKTRSFIHVEGCRAAAMGNAAACNQ